jgi:hypothetical protein
MLAKDALSAFQTRESRRGMEHITPSTLTRANLNGEEPDASIGLVRVCEGRGE